MAYEVSTWLGKPRTLLFTLPVLLLLFTIACGTTSAPDPVVVEKEVIKEVIKEVVKEVPVEKIVVVTPVIAVAPKNIKPVGTLNVGWTGLGPFFAHPALASGTATDVVSTSIAEALWQYDVKREAIPMLVESWDLSDDFTTWTLNLRRGVQFHKGYGEMTAEDVVWSMVQRASNPKATNVAPIKQAWETSSIEMPDPYTMVVNTGAPMPGWQFIDLVKVPGDQYVVSKEQTAEIGAEAANRNIAATGPWEIVEHRSGEFWKMRAVEDHWRKTPNFEEMIFFDIPEEATRLAAFQTGELDTFPMSYDAIALVTQVPGAKVMRIPKAAVMNLRIYGQDYVEIGTANQRAAYDPDLPWVSANPDLNSPEWEQAVKVRQALMLAIDIDSIIENLLQGFAEPSSVIFYGAHRHLEDPDMVWGYEPERAKQLLAEAGYSEGFSMTLTVAKRNAPAEVAVCEAIGAMWSDIGIDTKFQNVPFGTLRPGLIGRSYQGATCHAGTPPPTPARSYNGLTTRSGIYGITHPWLEDKAIRALGEVDPEKRIKLEREVARFLFDGAHLRELYIYDAVWPVGPRIEEWSEGVTFGDLRFQSGFEWIRHRE